MTGDLKSIWFNSCPELSQRGQLWRQLIVQIMIYLQLVKNITCFHLHLFHFTSLMTPLWLLTEQPLQDALHKFVLLCFTNQWPVTLCVINVEQRWDHMFSVLLTRYSLLNLFLHSLGIFYWLVSMCADNEYWGSTVGNQCVWVVNWRSLVFRFDTVNGCKPWKQIF